MLTAQTASFVANAQSASNAVAAQTASFANAFTVAGTLTAQTLVVQTITSSIDFVTGSTRFGSILGNTHVFSGSVTMNPGGLFVSSSGNIGIGTTNPATRFDLSGSIGNFQIASSGAEIFLTRNENNDILATGGTSSGITVGAQSYVRFGVGTSYTTRMFISSSGNVGIGTITPSNILTVVGGAASPVALNLSNANSNCDIIMTSGAGGGLVRLRNNLNDFQIHTNGTLALTLASNQAATFASSITAAGTIQTTNGNGLFTRTQVDLILNSTSTSQYGRLIFQENAVEQGVVEYINSGFGGFRASKLELANSGGITFVTEGNFTSPNMFINSSGNVLIGSTSNAFGLLDVTVAPSSYTATLGLGNTSPASEGQSTGISFKHRIALDNNVREGSRIAAITELVTLSGYQSLAFYTMNAITLAERMRILYNGNVGIGTIIPQTRLQIDAASASTSSTVLTINGSATGFSGPNDANTAYSINFDGCAFTSSTGIVTRTGAQIEMVKNGSWNQAAVGGGTNASLVFKTNNGTIETPALVERMRILSGGGMSYTGPYISMDGSGAGSFTSPPAGLGYGLFPHSGVGLGLSSVVGMSFWTGGTPTRRMTIDSSGNIGAPTGTNIYNASDRRLKQNIETITSGLDKITALNPVKFNWIDNFVESENGKDMLGFIAQEVDLIIPEAVEKFSDNTIQVGDLTINDSLRVNEKFIIPVLVKAIQELNTKLDAANAEIEALKAK